MRLSAVCPICCVQRSCRPVERCGPYILVHCPECDLVFSQPMRPADARWYDSACVVSHLAVDDRIREYYRCAIERIPVGSKVLDIGCGTGAFVDFARRMGLDAYGVDISSEAVKAGRERYDIDTLHVGSVRELPGHLRNFDAVTMFEVIEHVADPKAFVTDAIRLLRSGGLFLASVPNRERWPHRDFLDYPPHHLTRWSKASFEHLARSLRIEVVSVKATSRWRSLDFYLGYFPRTALYFAVGSYADFRKPGVRRVQPRVPSCSTTARLLSAYGSRLRKLRDALMWIPAVLLAPLLLPVVRGLNLVLTARRPE